MLLGVVGVPSAAADDGSALLRFAHLSPDTPAMDVALAPLPSPDGAPLTDPGPDAATGLRYGDVSAFTEVRPGSYAVSLRAVPAGTSSRAVRAGGVPAAEPAARRLTA